MSHIIGRPGDDLLDVMLGRGTDPEQAIIRGSGEGREDDDASEALADDEPTAPGP